MKGFSSYSFVICQRRGTKNLAAPESNTGSMTRRAQTRHLHRNTTHTRQTLVNAQQSHCVVKRSILPSSGIYYSLHSDKTWHKVGFMWGTQTCTPSPGEKLPCFYNRQLHWHRYCYQSTSLVQCEGTTLGSCSLGLSTSQYFFHLLSVHRQRHNWNALHLKIKMQQHCIFPKSVPFFYGA